PPRIVPSGHNGTDVGKRPNSWPPPRQKCGNQWRAHGAGDGQANPAHLLLPVVMGGREGAKLDGRQTRRSRAVVWVAGSDPLIFTLSVWATSVGTPRRSALGRASRPATLGGPTF